MIKKIMSTVILVEDFFETAIFGLKKGRFYEESSFSAMLNPEEKDNWSKNIKLLCQQKKVDLRRNFTLVIPRAQATIKDFELPSMSLNEIENMVNFQLQDSLPYRTEELIVQNLIYPSDKKGYSRVMSIVVQKELISKLLDILKKFSIKIYKIELSVVVLVNRFKALYKKEPFFEKTCLLINIENKNVDFIFIKKGEIILSRGILLSKENLEGNFLRETEKTLSLFKHKYSDVISSVFLWGKWADLTALANMVCAKTKLDVQVKENENLLKGAAYCSLSKENEINLMPKLIQEQQRRSIKRTNFLRMGGIIAAIILFLSLGLFFDLKEKQKQLLFIDNQIKSVETDALDVRAKSILIEAVSAKQEGILKPLEILSELYLITDSDISFNSFSLTGSNFIVIKGQAERLDKVLNFVSLLEAADLFENVELKYTAKRRIREKEIIDFETAFYVSQRR